MSQLGQQKGCTHSLLENGGIWVGNGLTDFLVGGVWADNAVLTLSSGLRVSPEFGLECLVAVDGGLEAAVDLADLGRVARVA